MDSILDGKVILKIFPERAFSGRLLHPDYSAYEIRTSAIQIAPPLGSTIFLHHKTGTPDLKIPLKVFDVGFDLHLQTPGNNQWLIALRVKNSYFDFLKKNYKEYI